MKYLWSNQRLLLLIVTTAWLYSCGGGDKLKGEMEILKGKYRWKGTGTSDGNIFSNNDPSVTPDQTGYTTAIELDDNGEIFFYKDGNLYHQSKYSVLEKDSYDEQSAYLYVKLKSTDQLPYLKDGKMVFRLSLDTTLNVEGYPFDGIDKASDYYQGHTAIINNFVRE